VPAMTVCAEVSQARERLATWLLFRPYPALQACGEGCKGWWLAAGLVRPAPMPRCGGAGRGGGGYAG
jgi:hypothetical protein